MSARDSRYRKHPLISFFGALKIWHIDGMNMLTEAGLISDNCITVDDVAPYDVHRVLVHYGAWWCDRELYAKRLSDRNQPNRNNQ